MAQNMVHENIWLDRSRYEDAECMYYEGKAKEVQTPLAAEVGRAREWLTNIKKCIEEPGSVHNNQCQISSMVALEEKLANLEKIVTSFQATLNNVVVKVKQIEEFHLKEATHPIRMAEVKSATKSKDKDDMDLFGTDSDEDDGADEVRRRRLADYENRKAKKPVLIAKSNIILDVKPWDDETDMKTMETEVRKIQTDGLVWGASKLVPLAYGIHKLQISCVVEDDIVSVDWLQEQIENFEDFVQSVDIAAFNKV